MHAREAREMTLTALSSQNTADQQTRAQKTAEAHAWVNTHIGDFVVAAEPSIKEAAGKGLFAIQYLHVCCQNPERAESWELLIKRLSEALQKQGFSTDIKEFRYDKEDRLCSYLYISWQ